jgi:hypothetical protein
MSAYALLLALVALVVRPTSALVEELSVSNDARYSHLSIFFLLFCPCYDVCLSSPTLVHAHSSVFHVETFGFEANGVFELELDNFIMMVPHDYVSPADEKYKVALVLQKSNTDGVNIQASTAVEGQEGCFHTDSIQDGDEIISLSSRTQWKSLMFKKTIQEPGFYHLYFSNCEATTQAQFSLKVTEYNIDSNGNKVYLPAGQASLPTWYFVISLAFLLQVFVWAGMIGKNSQNVRSIHWLMMLCLLLKTMTVFFNAFREHSIKTTGLKNDGWAYLYYIFSFLKGGMMFAVIVLIGTGWSYLKPFLTDRDKQLMLAVLVAQLMINVAAVIVDEETPGAQVPPHFLSFLQLH